MIYPCRNVRGRASARPRADSDANSDPNSDANPDTNSDADPDSDANSDSNADPDSNADSDSYADSNADSNADSDPNADSDSNSNADSDFNANSDSDSDSNSNSNSNSNPNSYFNHYTNTNRRRFERELDRRAGRPTLQPDDHQPRAGHGAAGRQRTGQLQRLRQRLRLSGSFSAGIHGRKEITPNLSLLAGIAYTQYSEGGYSVTSAPIGAFALRYDFVDWGSSRPFRHWRDPVAVREGALQPQLHHKPRFGVALQPDQQLELRRLCGGQGWISRINAARRDRGIDRGLAIVAAGQRLHRSEPSPSIRSMPRSLPAPIEPALAKVGAQWTHLYGSIVEANINGGFVQSFASHSGIVAAVTGDGTVTPTMGNQNWFEYGGRLGFRIANGWVADLFVNGTLGPQPVGNTIHGGVGLRVSY